MQAIKYTIEKYPSFETVEDKRLTVESTPQEFADLLRLFSDRRPHLLDGEQVKSAYMSAIPYSGSPSRLSRDCFPLMCHVSVTFPCSVNIPPPTRTATACTPICYRLTPINLTPAPATFNRARALSRQPGA